MADEYAGAVKKHPFFAHVLVSWNRAHQVEAALMNWRFALKDEIERGEVYATTVLQCELLEAIAEIDHGSYGAALVELAQCGAVVLRMMDMVRGMMEVSSHKGHEGHEGKVAGHGL